MLWLNGAAIGLSRNDLRALLDLVQAAAQRFDATPESLAGSPFGPDFAVLAAGQGWKN
jgi:hypothetical protein